MGDCKRCVVYCDDVNCTFKQEYRNIDKNKDECALDVQTAAKFFEKHGFTTCEYGMGEKTIYERPEIEKVYKWKIKHKGSV